MLEVNLTLSIANEELTAIPSSEICLPDPGRQTWLTVASATGVNRWLMRASSKQQHFCKDIHFRNTALGLTNEHQNFLCLTVVGTLEDHYRVYVYHMVTIDNWKCIDFAFHVIDFENIRVATIFSRVSFGLFSV